MTTPSYAYVGPRPFGPAEQHLFFGRSEETEILTSMVVARRASLLFAPSGAGKSSLLMAGLRQSLLEHRRVVRGRERIERLASGFVVARIGRGLPDRSPRNVFVQSALLSIAGEAEPADAYDVDLKEGLRRWLPPPSDVQERADAGALPFVLVFDQFEEMFTKHLEQRSHREGFFRQVRDALVADDRLRVLFSMREDFIGELTAYAHLLPDDLRHRFRLERLKYGPALEAVRRPPERAFPPRRYAEGAAETVVKNLQAGTSDDVEPILLQVVCSRIWSGVPTGTSEILPQDVANLSSIDRALMDYYDGAVATALAVAEGEVGRVSERRVRRFLGEAFITSSGTRAPVHRDDRTGITGAGTLRGIPNAVTDALAAPEVNLLRGEQRAGGRWYELAHDRLIKPLLAANEAWEQANETVLHRRAVRWQAAGAPESDLADAMELEELLCEADEPQTAIEEEFIRRSEQGLASLRVSQRANVEELGWGVVFDAGDPMKDEIRAALDELLEHRRRQGSARSRRQEFDYRPGETAQSFLARHGAAAVSASAALGEMPYYLLIVADPERIPFEVQYGIAMRHAVGRLHFESASRDETLSMYAAYARSVVAAESGEWALQRRALVFAPEWDDLAMTYANEHLVRSLIRDLGADDLLQAGWELEQNGSQAATRAALLDVLGGRRTPAVVFVASHGLGFGAGDERQRAHQGALVCADWPRDGTIEGCVTSRDVGGGATLLGLVAFLFSAFSAGTPRFANVDRRELAPRAFVSSLAQRLLGHPRGGALAVIGHVDVNRVGSFVRNGAGKGRYFEGARTFAQAVSRIMRGHTVGSAMEPIAARYRLVASELVDAVLAGVHSQTLSFESLKSDASDLRSYVILGDPAVRLPLDGSVPEARPTIEPVVPGRSPKLYAERRPAELQEVHRLRDSLAEEARRQSEVANGRRREAETRDVREYEGRRETHRLQGSRRDFEAKVDAKEVVPPYHAELREAEDVVVLNGVSLLTGTYFHAPAQLSQIAALVRGAVRSSP